MSFILEALKRADRERRLERAPDLSAVYEENSFSGHANIRPWLWLCGSFLVGAIVVGLMLWPKGPGPVKSPLPKDESTSLPLSSPGPIHKKKTRPPSFAKGSKDLEAKRSSGETPDSKPLPRPFRKANPARSTRILTEELVVVPPETKSKPVEKAPGLKPAPAAGEISDPGPGSVAVVKKRESVQPSRPISSSPVREYMAPAVSDRRKTAEKPAEPVGFNRAELPAAPSVKEQVSRKRIEAIPLLSELPSAIKEKLGKLQINVHSYS